MLDLEISTIIMLFFDIQLNTLYNAYNEVQYATPTQYETTIRSSIYVSF